MYELVDLEIVINLVLLFYLLYDEEWRKIMFVVNVYFIEEILNVCRYYIKKINRRVIFEYFFIKGVNDLEKEVKVLVKFLKGMLCYVNLILINKVEEREYEKLDKVFIYKFRDSLEKNNIFVIVRMFMGFDISGVCG